MRLSIIFTVTATFAAAAALGVVAAGFAVTEIEDASRGQVRAAFEDRDIGWTKVETDGLQVTLTGTAPTEAARFRALSVAGGTVDATRVIDRMQVQEAEGVAPPRFAMEILRGEHGISLIGLVPESLDRAQLLDDIAAQTGGAPVSDLLETADHVPPDTWAEALNFAVRALGDLAHTKISVSATRVAITAMAESAADLRRLETDLARRAPDDVRLALDLTAPRPVVTPFALRFVLDERGARFDACSADTEAARDRILSAAGRAGLRQKADCTVGMGVPSPRWAEAAEMAIAAVADLGGGSVTFTDADITLRAPEGTPQQRFDDVVGGLESALPEVFALKATRPEPPDDSKPETPDFIATLSPEGQVLMRGQLGSAQLRETATSFARARFSSDTVSMAARVAEGLPRDWPMRVLLGLEALSHLAYGAVTVTPDHVAVSGRTGDKGAGNALSALLSDTLKAEAQFSIDVTYDEALDPVAQLPSPAECQDRLAAAQDARKIGFEPGSAQIDADSVATMDRIADILRDCGEMRMEIAGHTDSQGREAMNQQLSLDRARAVLEELRLRRVATSRIEAEGYGESDPIADNDTAEGREINRRIEFRVARPEAVSGAATIPVTGPMIRDAAAADMAPAPPDPPDLSDLPEITGDTRPALRPDTTDGTGDEQD
ncbi:OmpA family protein [Roseovarius sp. D22-M7]|uniref:OmpA family protein n=1 Tax=Roseovarius sp. D22-M7 TaxID=3127116 RepID=UPI00300F88E5